MTLQLPIIRSDVEILATVELAFHRGRKGQRDSLCGIRGAGPALEPDDEPEWEVTSSDQDLTREEEAEAVDMAWKGNI